jgi:D-alanyl-D-alanine carboxypeptidase/D-alanyl-D-alanine-endopeptidase (penicillin-binding protein 4)
MIDQDVRASRLQGFRWGLVTALYLVAFPPSEVLKSGRLDVGAARLDAQTRGNAFTRQVDARLDAPPFDRQLWGVALVDQSGTLAYGRNADRMFIPASNTKLVVSAVAAALLPADFRVKTSVYAAGPVVNGVVQGALVLYGRGDPTLGVRCYAVDTTTAGVCDTDAVVRFRELAQGLRRAGITQVTGDLVGDGSYFEPTMIHGSWESYDLNWWYAAPVSALGLNDNAIDIQYAPAESAGPPARLSWGPDFGDVVLDNRTVTGARGTDHTIDFFREPGSFRVTGTGSVPQGAAPRTEHLAVPDPNLFAALALRSAMAEAGIAVLGATTSTTDSTRFELARRSVPLAEVQGRPLRDWIFPILNTSQNWYAEMTLKQLGRQFGKAGSWEEGLRVERRFLIDSVKIDSTQVALSDGSGLSASNLVSPLALTQLLRYMRQHRGYEAFAAGLPQSGKRGSLRNRFVGTPLEGRVRAKTGSISRTNTLAGYIERADGSVLTFAVMANHHAQRGSRMLAQIDSVVVDLSRVRSR